MAAQRRITLTPTQPAGPGCAYDLLGDATVGRGGSSGGWQVIDRPRRRATTQWLDTPPLTMAMTLMLDGVSYGHYRSVEAGAKITESWELPAAGSIQPPVLRIAGPVPHTDLTWVVQSLQWKEAIRDPVGGYRVQQTLDITLLEYVPATIAVHHSSPAKAAQSRQAVAHAATGTGTASHRRYTVKAGDTLSRIAAHMLGDYRRWPEIASLNHLRDPNRLTIGQTLILPASSTAAGSSTGSSSAASSDSYGVLGYGTLPVKPA